MWKTNPTWNLPLIFFVLKHWICFTFTLFRTKHLRRAHIGKFQVQRLLCGHLSMQFHWGHPRSRISLRPPAASHMKIKMATIATLANTTFVTIHQYGHQLYIWNDEMMKSPFWSLCHNMSRPISWSTCPQSAGVHRLDFIFNGPFWWMWPQTQNWKILACMLLPAISCHGNKPNLANEQEFIMLQLHWQNPSVAKNMVWLENERRLSHTITPPWNVGQENNVIWSVFPKKNWPMLS